MPPDKTIVKKMEVLRRFVDKQIKSINRTKTKGYIVMKGGRPDPRFTYKNDTKSDKILLSYSIPIQDLNKKKKYKMVRKVKYFKNLTFSNYKDELDILKDYQFVVKEHEDAISQLFYDEGSLEFWIEWFCDLERRKKEVILEEDAIKQRTLDGYKFYLYDYLNWLKENEPKFLSLASHNTKEGTEVFYDYLRHRSNKGGSKNRKWGSTTLHSSYKCIRALFNWLSRKEENQWFQMFRWSKMDKVPQPSPSKSSFTPNEIRKVLEFMGEYKEHPNWFWFIKILRVMLVSGCRIGEVVRMKINELQSVKVTDEDGIQHDIWRWNFIGKKDKTRTIYIDSDTAYQDIKDLITTDRGKIRTDKEYVFHRHFYKSSNPNQESMGSGFIERIDLPYSQSGVQHKFKKMVKFLGLNKSLTPHSCRRFFIQEKLRETNGDLNLVRLLVGHSSLKMVMYYHKTDQEYNSLIGVRNTLNLGEVKKRNERVV